MTSQEIIQQACSRIKEEHAKRKEERAPFDMSLFRKILLDLYVPEDDHCLYWPAMKREKDKLGPTK